MNAKNLNIEYEQTHLGYNYRMTDMQAALGISQLKRLDQFVKKRHAIVRRYDRLLADLPVILTSQLSQMTHWRYRSKCAERGFLDLMVVKDKYMASALRKSLP